MAQQINLYSPILMAPRRYFSAQTMAQALGLYALILFLLCGAAVIGSASLRRELAVTTQSQAAERDRLTQTLAVRPPQAATATALEQELTQLQQALAQQRRQVDELSRGRIIEGRSHAAMLKLVAQTVPAPVWLTELRLLEGRLELTGMTLQPEALRPWLGELAGHPLTAGQRLAAVKVERSTGSAVPASVEAWSFNVVSSAPPADPGGRPGALR